MCPVQSVTYVNLTVEVVSSMGCEIDSPLNGDVGRNGVRRGSHLKLSKYKRLEMNDPLVSHQGITPQLGTVFNANTDFAETEVDTRQRF